MADRRIWKYPLELRGGPQAVSMPHGAEIVHVHAQVLGGSPRPVLWAEVNDSGPTQERSFYVVATGEEIPFEARHHLGTIHIEWTVWHVYEKGKFA